MSAPASPRRPIEDGYGLHVVAGTRARPPWATFTCPCGHVQRARGQRDVTALASTYIRHYAACPLRLGEAA